MNTDEIDRRILGELQRDSSRSVQEIADAVGLSATPTARRIRLMKEAGIIAREAALLDADKLGLKITAFIFVSTSHHTDDWLKTFARGIQDIPEITEFYRLSGNIDYFLKAVVPDIAHYDRVYKKLIKIAPLSDVSSSFAMEELKATTELPLFL